MGVDKWTSGYFFPLVWLQLPGLEQVLFPKVHGPKEPMFISQTLGQVTHANS